MRPKISMCLDPPKVGVYTGTIDELLSWLKIELRNGPMDVYTERHLDERQCIIFYDRRHLFVHPTRLDRVKEVLNAPS